ncbi:MAG TPA: DNA polymerase/3'-5' exonuclease PolX [Anaeromyxobacteraceae bacterium]|nr:DNA polymerase/3'-5' exonuclease PolX [Anaeromyxobacteraceae bacterium]
MLDKPAVARALREIGALLEVKGENPFKVRAYATGALALEEAVSDLPRLVAEDRLTELRGIGQALAKKIKDLHVTGHTELLDRLHSELPAGILELLELPDLGPRKVAMLHAELKVGSIADLEAVCRKGLVRHVRGFGPKTEQRILEALTRRERRQARLLLPDALEVGRALVAHIGQDCAERLELAGSARRGEEVVERLDLVASTRRPAELSARFLSWRPGAEVLGQGESGLRLRLEGGIEVALRGVPPAEYVGALHFATGSVAHRLKLGELAREEGYHLTPSGLTRIDTGESIHLDAEEDLYARLSLPFIPPELREDAGEIEAARAGTLPRDLVELKDVRGFVHCHTRWSDGRSTLEEMALAADALGADYLTVTDHSPSAGYAGGLSIDRLKAQWEEIARVQEKVRVRLLRGTESDITEEGVLDYPDAVLEALDVVVASVHSRHHMGEEEMTRRLVRAMRLPIFKIWGHPRGRLLLERDPFACRMEEVLDALASSKGAVEVNGDPKRLELDPVGLRLARERGIPIVLSVDAHSRSALGYLRFAVATARRGWVRRGEVLNTLSHEQFRQAVRPAS